MVKDHLYSEIGNILPPLHDYSFRLAARGFYMHHPADRISHTTTFVTPVVDHWLERVLSQWVHHEGSIRRPNAPLANELTMDLHLAPRCDMDLVSINVFERCLVCVTVRQMQIPPSIKGHPAKSPAVKLKLAPITYASYLQMVFHSKFT